MTQNLNLAIAFAGGLLTFFSPCFLPLVPAYLVYITGLSFEEVKNVRLMSVIHSLLFIFGFTIVFTFLGISASLLGQFFYDLRDAFRIAGGILIILLGLYLTGMLRLPFLDLERRLTISSRPAGLLGSVFIGMVFALGWLPCVGPILAGILILASHAETLGQGALMLISFSLGLGFPLFLASLALNYFLSFSEKIEKHLRTVHKVSGIFLIAVGILLITNYLQGVTNWLIDLTGYKGI
ncbi:hypothetical protein AMJ44_07710 [candidate division WOR-1 bacterium DG_54_3]|uniref:Cytochrome C biogenesis protein transmembrane domain-containing protein n=1 Tax=candidate division WOR-1 bacterium DG_54_3 TaxID=1703775 RepID=A0A0S7XWP0_UNCSA|nr:MAG: hypothetical protein AMJ44_07710 [candidate division WOR-1 bacterium DG_54_3]